MLPEGMDPMEFRIRRGKLAVQLMDDAFSEAFEQAEADCVRRWKDGETVDARELAFRDFQAGKRFQTVIAGWVEDGRMAERNLALANRKGKV